MKLHCFFGSLTFCTTHASYAPCIPYTSLPLAPLCALPALKLLSSLQTTKCPHISPRPQIFPTRFAYPKPPVNPAHPIPLSPPAAPLIHLKLCILHFLHLKRTLLALRLLCTLYNLYAQNGILSFLHCLCLSHIPVRSAYLCMLYPVLPPSPVLHTLYPLCLLAPHTLYSLAPPCPLPAPPTLHLPCMLPHLTPCTLYILYPQSLSHTLISTPLANSMQLNCPKHLILPAPIYLSSTQPTHFMHHLLLHLLNFTLPIYLWHFTHPVPLEHNLHVLHASYLVTFCHLQFFYTLT